MKNWLKAIGCALTFWLAVTGIVVGLIYHPEVALKGFGVAFAILFLLAATIAFKEEFFRD